MYVKAQGYLQTATLKYLKTFLFFSLNGWLHKFTLYILSVMSTHLDYSFLLNVSLRYHDNSHCHPVSYHRPSWIHYTWFLHANHYNSKQLWPQHCSLQCLMSHTPKPKTPISFSVFCQLSIYQPRRPMSTLLSFNNLWDIIKGLLNVQTHWSPLIYSGCHRTVWMH